MNDILLPIVQTINTYLSDYILVILLLGCGLLLEALLFGGGFFLQPLALCLGLLLETLLFGGCGLGLLLPAQL